MAVQTLISPEEYLAIPYDGRNREYDEGRVIEMSFAGFEHGTIQGRLFQHFNEYVQRTGTPLAVSLSTGFWVADRTERGPDVCVVRRSELAAMPKFRGSRRGSPDLAVEIVSTNDRASEIERKCGQYLAGGSTAVWLVYPDTQRVIVERRGGEIHKAGPGGFLEEPDLMPGLRIPVDDLFRGL